RVVGWSEISVGGDIAFLRAVIRIASLQGGIVGVVVVEICDHRASHIQPVLHAKLCVDAHSLSTVGGYVMDNARAFIDCFRIVGNRQVVGTYRRAAWFPFGRMPGRKGG